MSYDKNIEIYKKGTPIENSIGQLIYGKPLFIKSMVVDDIQPYSSEEAKKDYGFTIVCTKRMFCSVEDINIGNSFIKYNNKNYEVVKIPWDDEYMEVILNETSKEF